MSFSYEFLVRVSWALVNLCLVLLSLTILLNKTIQWLGIVVCVKSCMCITGSDTY